MTYSQQMPAVDQLDWGEELRNNIGSVIDPNTGGINIAENIAHRDSKFWPNGDANHDNHKNFTVYVTETGTFYVWIVSTNPANTRYWRELQKTITSQGWIDGQGTVSGYGLEVRGTGTSFQSMGLKVGSFIRFPASLIQNVPTTWQDLEITEVVSNTLLKVAQLPAYRRIGNAGSLGEVTTSISVTNISNNTVTFSGNITGTGIKAGDTFYNYNTVAGEKSYYGIVVSVSTNTIEASWIVVGTATTPFWWSYSTITNATYKTQEALGTWNNGERNVATIKASGYTQLESLLVANPDKKRQIIMGAYGFGGNSIGSYTSDPDRAVVYEGICEASDSWGRVAGDYTFNYTSNIGTNNKVMFMNNSAGFLFVVNQLSNSRELFITSGRVGINNTSPTQALHVVGNILATGTITPGSDRRWKEDIVKIDSALSKISLLEGVTYHWKDKEFRGSDRQIGLIAQDVEKAFPEAVKKDNEGFMSLNYDGLVGALVEAIKEQQVMINELKSEVSELKSKLA